MARVPANVGGEPEIALAGGNMSEVVRRGQAVHRSAGPWTPTIHRLLRHLHRRGIKWLPRPLGFDEHGREVLTYLPGTVPSYPMPSWVWSEGGLREAGRRLAQFHCASADFDTTGALWQIPTHQPAEVICINDVAPYNMVFDDNHQLVGMIDLDTASPGPRVWDLAYLAYRLTPLTVNEDTGAGKRSLAARRQRLELLRQAYAHAGDCVEVAARDVLRTAIDRLEDLSVFTAKRAAAGATQLAAHVEIYRNDAKWLKDHLADLTPS